MDLKVLVPLGSRHLLDVSPWQQRLIHLRCQFGDAGPWPRSPIPWPMSAPS